MSDTQVPEDAAATPPIDENKLIAERRLKLSALRSSGASVFPNDFRRDSLASELHLGFGEMGAEALNARAIKVHLAGRMMLRRIMGKASFAKIQDSSGQIQLYLQRDVLGDQYEAFKAWDIGDILGAKGTLFRTKTGELSVRVESARLLVKSLRPLPDKWHGLADTEVRYRQRYVDLIMNEDSRSVFRKRTQLVRYLRDMLDTLGFMEVETPMMQPIPGGATARPFVTHHNALDIDMYLRVAPELYLKRLVVGGFERIYEINRNFRNESFSSRHNPEFTMLELYQAYADYHDLMDLVERIMRGAAEAVVGTLEFNSLGRCYDLSKPFERISVEDMILRENPNLERSKLRDIAYLRGTCEKLGIPLNPGDGVGKLQIEIFEKTGEHTLQDPTFVFAYPAEVSPLSRANDTDPFLTDRFEFFVGGRELANGFSELNDSEDQAARFRAQVARKESGDDEAMFFDADYVRALEYGMPPAAGLGVGIDRLVGFLTDSPSIRDVLLFPQMRPE
ncbi:MAG: lysine--tRNA ligase [Gammaproteobacteria bacterium]|nr:lysine--tRNA ligase [Gammaproteobacteria bacterium]